MPPDLHVIDADGHVLEPIDIWDKYVDPVEGRLRTRTCPSRKLRPAASG